MISKRIGPGPVHDEIPDLTDAELDFSFYFPGEARKNVSEVESKTVFDAPPVLPKITSKSKCWNCFKEFGDGLKKCGRCKEARYCSAECQKEHWATHKKDCRPSNEPTDQ